MKLLEPFEKGDSMAPKVARHRRLAGLLPLLAVLCCFAAYKITLSTPSQILNDHEANRIADGR